MPTTPFKPFGVLMNEAWALFRPRIKLFLILAVILGLLSIVGALLSLTIVLIPIVVIASIVITVVFSLAEVYAVVGEPKPIGELLGRAWKSFWPYLILSVLGGLVIIGGFAILIIPGIILSVYLSFMAYTFAVEGLRGRAALRQSHAYVEGAWFDVFWRLLVAGLLAGIIVGIVNAIFSFLKDSYVWPLISAVFSSLAGAWALCFSYRVYLNAKERAADQLQQPKGFWANHTAWAIIGIVGAIIIPIFWAAAMFAVFRSATLTN